MPTKAQTGTKATDRQTYPLVMIPKPFYTRYKPSWKAIVAYNAIKFFASSRNSKSTYTTVPAYAAMVNVSLNTFKDGVKELEKKGLVRVRSHTRKTTNGNRQSLPNEYEILEIPGTGGSEDESI